MQIIYKHNIVHDQPCNKKDMILHLFQNTRHVCTQIKKVIVNKGQKKKKVKHTCYELDQVHWELFSC